LTIVETSDDNLDEFYCLQTVDDEILIPEDQIAGILRDILGIIYLGNDSLIGVDFADLYYILKLHPLYISRLEIPADFSDEITLKNNLQTAIHDGTKTLKSAHWYGILTFHYSEVSGESFDLACLIEISQSESDSDTWIYSLVADLLPNQTPYLSIMFFVHEDTFPVSNIELIPDHSKHKEVITS
jgi:hypothetical protein